MTGTSSSRPTRMNSSAAEPRSGSSSRRSVQRFERGMSGHLQHAWRSEQADEREGGAHGHLDSGMTEGLVLPRHDIRRVALTDSAGHDLEGAPSPLLQRGV